NNFGSCKTALAGRPDGWVIPLPAAALPLATPVSPTGRDAAQRCANTRRGGRDYGRVEIHRDRRQALCLARHPATPPRAAEGGSQDRSACAVGAEGGLPVRFGAYRRRALPRAQPVRVYRAGPVGLRGAA